MSGKGHDHPGNGESQLREREHENDKRHGHSETDRSHKPRHTDGDRHEADHGHKHDHGHKPRRHDHAPHRPEGDLPHTMGKVSLDEILERHPKADRRRVPRSPKAQLFVTLAHWSMTLLLGLNLFTGMRIGWGYEESPLGGMRGALGAFFQTIAPGAKMFGLNIIYLHVWSAFAMLLVTGVYVGYLFKSGTARKLEVTRADLHKLMHGLKSGHFWRNKAALWSANVLAYWVSFVFITVLTFTGFALYRLDLGLAAMLGGYDLNRVVHAVVGYMLIPYTILHAVLQWFFGRFWAIFKAQVWRKHVLAGVLGLIVSAPIAVGAFYLDKDVNETLAAPRLTSAPAPVLDGDGSDPAWATAQPVMVHTGKATNAPGHVSNIEVKAVHDGSHVYFRFVWKDPDASYKRYPLMKTEGGWKVLGTDLAFEQNDENQYYEDKLSMYITDVKNGSCATTCHLGASPESPKNTKHGLHYTVNGEIADVWHWKAIRTNHMGDPTGEPSWLDDMYFGPKQPIKPGTRYTGGYYPDPDKGAGYAYNFTKVDPSKPLRDGYVVPKFLPHNGEAVHTGANPATHELGKQWWLFKNQVIPYTKEADVYPVGTLIPNILIQPFTGDRADVRAKAEWKDGRWTLETRRVLDTGSKYDVAFVPGRPVYITVAAYHRTQTRHSEHIKPIRVVLEP